MHFARVPLAGVSTASLETLGRRVLHRGPRFRVFASTPRQPKRCTLYGHSVLPEEPCRILVPVRLQQRCRPPNAALAQSVLLSRPLRQHRAASPRCLQRTGPATPCHATSSCAARRSHPRQRPTTGFVWQTKPFSRPSSSVWPHRAADHRGMRRVCVHTRCVRRRCRPPHCSWSNCNWQDKP
jgi:hypothetical protein